MEGGVDMMQGVSGMSNAGGMPRNCGMQGMHGNSQTKQAPKAEEAVAKQQNNQPIELPRATPGKIDIRI